MGGQDGGLRQVHEGDATIGEREKSEEQKDGRKKMKNDKLVHESKIKSYFAKCFSITREPLAK